jgi:hypothetical protein
MYRENISINYIGLVFFVDDPSQVVYHCIDLDLHQDISLSSLHFKDDGEFEVKIENEHLTYR